MDKAKDIDEFVQKLAESLSIGQTARYDMDNLTYGEVHQMQMDEYWEYVEMDELPDNLEDELKDWEIDEVKYLREVLELPDEIDPPRTWVQLEWMADFANEQSLGDRFIRDVQRALYCRHPFGAFKDVMWDYGLLDDWYSYRDDCYRAYVRRESGFSDYAIEEDAVEDGDYSEDAADFQSASDPDLYPVGTLIDYVNKKPDLKKISKLVEDYIPLCGIKRNHNIEQGLIT